MGFGDLRQEVADETAEKKNANKPKTAAAKKAQKDAFNNVIDTTYKDVGLVSNIRIEREEK